MGYEGRYEVSTLGRIRGLKRGSILSPRANCRNGYLEVNLCKNGTQKTIRVHRLVAETFLPNPNCLLEVNHKDENKHNNSIDNLEWCDRYYNTSYGNRNKILGEHIRKRCAKISSLEVEKIKLLRDNNTVQEIARMFDISDSQVYRILNGTSWRDIS